MKAPLPARRFWRSKSRYAADAWLTAAQSLNDPLRERRRDAYVAYLTGQRDPTTWQPLAWGADTNSLFDYFLIDSQMSSCMATSRVVQGYAAVQLFVERCFSNLEPNVDVTQDDAWGWWSWMKRYRLWQANREIFLWPENWLVETDRPNRSELFDKLMDETRQAHATADELETVVLNYIDRLDQIAHLRVTGMCQDVVTGTTHVIARTHADPPRFYHRTFDGTTWMPWAEITLSIKAHQVVPMVHRRSLYLFWPEVKLANEPQQSIPPAQGTLINGSGGGQVSTSATKSRPAARYAEIDIGFSFWRNGNWAPSQLAGSKFYDVPQLLNDPKMAATVQTVERLYSIKLTPPVRNASSDIYVDIHRLGFIDRPTVGFLALVLDFTDFSDDLLTGGFPLDKAPHIGRAVFDGRFNTLALRDMSVLINSSVVSSSDGEPFLQHAQRVYGAAAEKLVGLDAASVNPDLIGDSGLVPKGGAWPRNRSPPA